MVNAPTLASSTGSSMIELIAIVLLVAGVGFALSAIPAFREKATEHAIQIRSLIDPKAPKPVNDLDRTNQVGTRTSGATTLNESAADTIRRREIDDFDYTLFDL